MPPSGKPIGMAKRKSGLLENVKTMCWSTAEIEQQIEREPRLGLALVQYLVRRGIELQDRIQARAVCKTPERVMIATDSAAARGSSPTLM